MQLKIIVIVGICLIVLWFYRKSYLKQSGGASFLENNRTQQLDDIFMQSTTYENEDGRQGLDICLEKCKGNCVEFGMHGKSFCFASH